MPTPRPAATVRLEHLLAGGVRAWREVYLPWIRRHPLLADAALAGVLLWQSGPHVTGLHDGRQALAAALIPAVLLPLVWRRRAPFAVFMIIAALALAQLFVSRELTDDAALLVAFYTLAALAPPRHVLAALGVLVAGGAVAAVRHTLGSASAWTLVCGLVLAAGLLGCFARTRRAYLAALVDRAQRLERERHQDAELAATGERTRIAREMHDIVAHNIAVMIALADGAAYTAVDSPGQAVSLMGEVSATGRSALTEMRRLLGVLRQPAAPGHAPTPTLADVDDLIAAVNAAGLPAGLTVTGQPFPLPPSAQLALYRMIQEALTNTLKHATAVTSVRVQLSYLPGQVGLEVTDDGRPRVIPAGEPAAGAAQGAAGHGIVGMRERASVFGGMVSAGPRPGGGWRVHTVLYLGPVRSPA